MTSVFQEEEVEGSLKLDQEDMIRVSVTYPVLSRNNRLKYTESCVLVFAGASCGSVLHPVVYCRCWVKGAVLYMMFTS